MYLLYKYNFLSTRFAHSKWVIEELLKFRMRALALSGYYLRYLKDDIVGYF